MSPLPPPAAGRRRPLAALALAALAAAPAAAQGGEPPAGDFGERIEVTAVSVPVRVRGAGAAPLRVEDLALLEDGQPVTLLAVEPLAPVGAAAAAPAAGVPGAAPPGPAWRVVLYFDLQLAGVTSVRQAAWQLGGEADRLVALGEVEVALADDRVERAFGPSRDAEALRKALRKKVADHFGQRRVLRLRQEFFAQSSGSIGLVRRRPAGGAVGTGTGLVRAFGAEETRLLESRRQLLEGYFAERSVPDWPQAAFLVTGGYDLEPGEFYLPMAEGSTAQSPETQRLRADFDRFSQSRSAAALARQLAALGWTVFPVLPFDQEFNFSGSAANDGSSRWRAMDGGGAVDSAPPWVLRHPDEPWDLVAEATGGERIGDLRRLEQAVAGLESRWRVTYQIGRRKDGTLHRLEIRPLRAGLELSGPGWIASGTPEALAAARARALLGGEAAAGDLPVAARVEAAPADAQGMSAGRIEARVEFAPLGAARAALGATTLRFTIAVARPDGTVMVIHERAEAVDLRERAGWIFEARLLAPAGTDRVAVVAEELGTGAWGGTVARWKG